MINELLFALNVLLYLSIVLVLYKVFGKNGLFVYSVFSTLLASVAVCKCFSLFGFTANAGIVQYASTFLITDILSEKYGKKEAEKAVYYSISAMIMWVVGTQLVLLFSPNDMTKNMSDTLSSVFGLTPRIFAASMIANVCSQKFDVFMYHFIWNKTGNSKKMLWLRNNGSTAISQALDTVIFIVLAFWGVYPSSVVLNMVFTTHIFKALVALFDTPFMYAARKIKPLAEDKDNSKDTEVPSKEVLEGA